MPETCATCRHHRRIAIGVVRGAPVVTTDGMCCLVERYKPFAPSRRAACEAWEETRDDEDRAGP